MRTLSSLVDVRTIHSQTKRTTTRIDFMEKEEEEVVASTWQTSRLHEPSHSTVVSFMHSSCYVFCGVAVCVFASPVWVSCLTTTRTTVSLGETPNKNEQTNGTTKQKAKKSEKKNINVIFIVTSAFRCRPFRFASCFALRSVCSFAVVVVFFFFPAIQFVSPSRHERSKK